MPMHKCFLCIVLSIIQPLALPAAPAPNVRANWAARLVLLLLLMLPATVPAQDCFTFRTNYTGNLTITGYTCTNGDVSIPTNINNRTVMSIAPLAFSNCTSLTSVTIPDSVVRIGAQAFLNCTRLTRVTIPDSVTNIMERAFEGCTSLTSAAIPNSVAYIGAGAFSACTSLNAIMVDPLNRFYSSMEGVLFNWSHTTLLQCPGGKTGSYTIPNSITNIEDRTFAGCSGLTSLTIPNSVTYIGEEAFKSCYKLTNITLPNSVTSLGEGAFNSCSGLTTVTIPNTVTSIGPDTFANCWRLTSVSLPNSVTYIGNGAFDGCNLTNVTIPNSVTYIGAFAFHSAFNSRYNLTSVTIPNSVTYIGDFAFANCNSLTNIIVGNGIGYIGNYAFSFCINLAAVYFKGNAPTVDVGVPLLFYGTSNATVFYLPGTTGWSNSFADGPTAVWHLPYPCILDCRPYYGVKTNRFEFRISWATNASVVVEANTNLANPSAWTSITTNTIRMGRDPLTDGWASFSDPEWTNSPVRCYRLRSP